MDVELDDLTYCYGKCGENFHLSCTIQAEVDDAVCLACSKKWETPPALVEAVIHNDFPLHEFGICMYCDWLYSDQIRLLSTQDAGVHTDLMLIYAWTIGTGFDNDDFLNAVVATYVERRLRKPNVPHSPAPVNFAWETARFNEDDNCLHLIRDAFLASGIAFDDKAALAAYPADWVLRSYKEFLDLKPSKGSLAEDGYEMQYEDGEEAIA